MSIRKEGEAATDSGGAANFRLSRAERNAAAALSLTGRRRISTIGCERAPAPPPAMQMRARHAPGNHTAAAAYVKRELGDLTARERSSQRSNPLPLKRFHRPRLLRIRPERPFRQPVPVSGERGTHAPRRFSEKRIRMIESS